MRRVIAWCLLVVVSTGCADGSKAPSRTTDKDAVHTSAEAKPVASQESVAEGNAKASQPPGAENPQRKIIFTATVNLIVEQFDAVPEHSRPW